MAIVGVDGIIAGSRPPENFYRVGATMEAAGVMHSFFYTKGFPGHAVVGTSGENGEALTSYAGQIPWVNPAAGYSYVSRFEAQSTTTGAVLLMDRLWQNSSTNGSTNFNHVATGAQTFSAPVAIPARDRDGTNNGVGVMVALEVETATTNGSPITAMTLNYTNSAGTSSRTGTMASFPATAVAGTFVPFELQAGDVGVKRVDGITLATSLGATAKVCLVAYRQLARLDCLIANVGTALDAITGGMPRCHDNTVPFLCILPTTTTAATVSGQLTIIQG